MKTVLAIAIAVFTAIMTFGGSTTFASVHSGHDRMAGMEAGCADAPCDTSSDMSCVTHCLFSGADVSPQQTMIATMMTTVAAAAAVFFFFSLRTDRLRSPVQSLGHPDPISILTIIKRE